MFRPLYRSRQVLQALRPQIDAGELDFAREMMSAAEADLFFAMERRDQRHALEVAMRLRRGTDDRTLLVAALLHDCGKGSVPVWLRILNVLSPAATDLLAAEGRGWRGAAHRLRHHAELGALKARDAGCTETAVRLIQGHVEPEEAWQHVLLRAADDAS
ncbi:MAG TPA: HD domain-containing protein [Dehalococcoidia bacterium]|nr:HD domain-containing protein [Dehalococcoidia bacterium]